MESKNTSLTNTYDIVSRFATEGTVADIRPLGNGLINDTYKVSTKEADAPDYVLQRVNTTVFTDVDMLMDNIAAVTRHIRKKLEAANVTDIDRKVLRFIAADGGKLYHREADGTVWRMMVFIPNAKTYEAVTPEYSYFAGNAFGHFEDMLVDIPEKLGEVIPDFHNMEFRMKQLREVIEKNPAGRVGEDAVKQLLDLIGKDAEEMCKAERMGREGKLPKRVCHCDTKVNNMMFDEEGHVLCVIDLDTVMPSFVFSDYGDFLRSAANTTAEDDPDMSHVAFNEEIFKAFTRGYIEGARFLTPVETENLPYAVALFPFMQSVRFLWDYLSGDHYWKCKYPQHNLDRARNQMRLYQCVREHDDMMREYIKECQQEQNTCKG
ncbi:MAG: aminoglycoside phosphotransferase family protein [Prevotella sp.]|nr:aminoglycoside phosphotransferase family protein [Prevotella sp.]MDD7190428.1 aminoglycoside phosphotransferase family protein [Prevotella sp.]